MNEVTKTIQQQVQEICDDVCTNYCKYRETADEDFICEIVRDGKDCPLDRLT